MKTKLRDHISIAQTNRSLHSQFTLTGNTFPSCPSPSPQPSSATACCRAHQPRRTPAPAHGQRRSRDKHLMSCLLLGTDAGA
jgi:hypothetical protein